MDPNEFLITTAIPTGLLVLVAWSHLGLWVLAKRLDRHTKRLGQHAEALAILRRENRDLRTLLVSQSQPARPKHPPAKPKPPPPMHRCAPTERYLIEPKIERILFDKKRPMTAGELVRETGLSFTVVSRELERGRRAGRLDVVRSSSSALSWQTASPTTRVPALSGWVNP